MHRGHRKRMRDRIKRYGAESLCTHELLEVLLYLAIPVKDTNALAHRLLDRFGSIQNVLNADKKELTSVEGVGENTAFVLNYISSIMKMCGTENCNSVHMNTLKKAAAYGISLFAGVQREEFYALMLDNSMKMISCRKIAEGGVSSVSADISSVMRPIVDERAAAVIFLHNHPGGEPIPSNEDMAFTYTAEQMLSTIGVPLVEHILIAGVDYTPILKCSKSANRKSLSCGGIDQKTVRNFYFSD